jgi:hypothetical protein
MQPVKARQFVAMATLHHATVATMGGLEHALICGEILKKGRGSVDTKCVENDGIKTADEESWTCRL